MQKYNFFTTLFTLLVYLVSLPIAAAPTGLNGTVNALTVIHNDGPALYAGTNQGLYLSRNNGREWTLAGLDGRNITDIAVHPADRDIIYVAVGNDGVVRSANGGKDWDTLNIRLPDSREHGDIRALATDKSSPSTLYAASFQGYIFKSTDEGRSWSTINPEFPFQALNALAVDPAAGNILYVGTGGNGIYKSTNSGADWTLINNNLADLSVTRVVIDPADPSTLFVGTYGGGVHISRDHGQSWSAANTGLSDSYIYALAAYGATTSDGKKSGLIGKLKETITGGLAGPADTDLLVGVYGGDLFRATSNGDLSWKPLAAEQRKMKVKKKGAPRLGWSAPSRCVASLTTSCKDCR